MACTKKLATAEKNKLCIYIMIIYSVILNDPLFTKLYKRHPHSYNYMTGQLGF